MATGTDSGDGADTLAGHQLLKFLESEETTPELVREVIWRITDLIKEILRSQRRASILVVVFAFVFELLNRSLVNEASFAGIKLRRIEFLATLTPVAITYSYLRFAALSRDLSAYMHVLYRLTERRFRGLYESDLDRMLIYVAGPTFATIPRPYAPYGRRIGAWTSVIELSVYNLIPVTFTTYAFWQLFSARGPTDVLVWVSLLASALLLVAAFAFAAVSFRMLNDPDGARDREELLSMFHRNRREQT